MKAFFDKFKNLKPDGQNGLHVEAAKPELVVVSYEFLNFIRLKDANDFEMYMTAEEELERIRGHWSDEAQTYREQVYDMQKGLTVTEYKSPTRRVLLYEPLMFIEESGGPDNYNPNDGYEPQIARCLHYLHERAREDFESLDLSSLKEVVVFSGLHGEGIPIQIADSLASEFGLEGRVTVISTGCNEGMSRRIAEIVRGERVDISNKITPYLEPPYVKCVWFPEQRREDLRRVQNDSGRNNAEKLEQD